LGKICLTTRPGANGNGIIQQISLHVNATFRDADGP
jgi:hypothetical protein